MYTKSGAEKGVWKVPIEGGDPVRLSDTAGSSPSATSPAVSPDGKWIAYSYYDPKATPQRGVAIVELEGGRPVKDLDISTRSLRWTPDGRSLLYIKNDGGVSNLWEHPIAGGTPTQITHFSSDEITDFDVSPDGKRVVMELARVTSDVVLIRDVR